MYGLIVLIEMDLSQQERFPLPLLLPNAAENEFGWQISNILPSTRGDVNFWVRCPKGRHNDVEKKACCQAV